MASLSSAWASSGFEFPELPVASPSDIDEFLEDRQRSSESLEASEGRRSGFWDEDGEEKESSSDPEESRKFWESQHQLLQAILCRSSPTESRIRNAVKEALKEAEMAGPEICHCGQKLGVAGGSGCRNCSIERVSGSLQKAGFNIAVCKSKWTSSPYIPSGEHTFLDVLEPSKKLGVVRIIIELNFRTEFEMARSSDEYSRLVRRLPEAFVGKVDQLESVIRTLCTAAKKCMKERKMHIGPWRKRKYMHAKWLGPCERRAPLPLPPPPIPPKRRSDRPRRPKASMLTAELANPCIHRTPVEVV